MPDAMEARYKEALKSVYPVPLDPETKEVLYTDEEWMLRDVAHQIKVRIATLESKAKAKANVATAINEDIIFT